MAGGGQRGGERGEMRTADPAAGSGPRFGRLYSAVGWIGRVAGLPAIHLWDAEPYPDSACTRPARGHPLSARDHEVEWHDSAMACGAARS